MSRSRKASSNTVVLMIADGSNTVVGRFESGPEGDSDKITPAATKANAFIQAVLDDSEHPYHQDLMEHGFERWNDTPELLKPKMALTI